MGFSFDLPLDPRAVVGLHDFAPCAVWGRYLGDAQPYPGAGHPAPRKIDSSGKECFWQVITHGSRQHAHDRGWCRCGRKHTHGTCRRRSDTITRNTSVEIGQFFIDWCCFYYFVRNSLVALLEALCARIFCFGFVNIGVFPDISFLVCKAFVSNKNLSPAPLNQAPVPGCRHSSCVLIVHVCLCVCASVCACENV